MADASASPRTGGSRRSSVNTVTVEVTPEADQLPVVTTSGEAVSSIAPGDDGHGRVHDDEGVVALTVPAMAVVHEDEAMLEHGDAGDRGNVRIQVDHVDRSGIGAGEEGVSFGMGEEEGGEEDGEEEAYATADDIARLEAVQIQEAIPEGAAVLDVSPDLTVVPVARTVRDVKDSIPEDESAQVIKLATNVVFEDAFARYWEERALQAASDMGRGVTERRAPARGPQTACVQDVRVQWLVQRLCLGLNMAAEIVLDYFMDNVVDAASLIAFLDGQDDGKVTCLAFWTTRKVVHVTEGALVRL